VATAGGLSVYVGYAEDKEIETPDPAAFPVPWAGAPNTTFLGGTVPGQAACGTLTACYDAGAIRLDNPGATPITVSSVSVDDHSSLPGGKVFDNLWGSFTVAPGQSVILTENPPGNNPGYDNFDTSGFPSQCTPITVAPTVTITVNGVATTLADSTHVLDSGGTDRGSCPPKTNESIQWRAIGAAGSDDATLTLGPATVSAVAGTPVTETATLLDGSGDGLPNATVNFTVTSGPDAGTTGSAITNANGQATFTYAGAQGEDELVASVTTVGTFSSAPARVLWTDDSATGWTGSDIGTPSPAGSQSFQSSTGTWTLSGGGTGVEGTSDQFHFVRQTEPTNGGVAARVVSLGGGSASSLAGVMLRASTAAGSPFYAALVAPAGGTEVLDRTAAGGATSTVVDSAGSVPVSVWIARTGTTLTTYTSSDGFSWTPLAGSQATVGLGAAALGGLAVTSGLPGTLETAALDTIALSTSPPAPLPPEACPSPFTCADIGSPALAGTQSYDPNSSTWAVTAGGTDITGTSDQFHFVSAPLVGDGSVSADVTSQSDTDANAKAGVMLRASSDPGSPEYSVLVSPGAGIKVQERSTENGTTTKLANPTGTAPAYLEVTRSGSTFTASTSPDGVNWTVIPGSSFTMSLPATLLGGLAVTSHNAGELGTATMDAVTPPVGSTPPTTTTTSSTLPPEPCPSPFTCADIGSPALAGTQSYDPNSSTWTVTAGGTDITGTSDQFHFVSEPVTGDGNVSADVTSQTDSSSNAKAGVMLRASSDPGSPEYSVLVSPGAGIKVQERSTEDGTTTKLANPTGTAPAYLEVTRSGSTFTASTSPDGVNWTVIPGSSFTMSLPVTLLGGLAVTSHNAGELGTATMDAVTVG
jgi:outer membrane lipoprotein-sorting protein